VRLGGKCEGKRHAGERNSAGGKGGGVRKGMIQCLVVTLLVVVRGPKGEEDEVGKRPSSVFGEERQGQNRCGGEMVALHSATNLTMGTSRRR